MKEICYKNFVIVENHLITTDRINIRHPYFKLNQGKNFYLNYCAVYCKMPPVRGKAPFLGMSFPSERAIYLYCTQGQTNLCLVMRK